MEHSELIQEMALLEKLTAQERLKHAKRRRQQQLTNWSRREAAEGNSPTVSLNVANGTGTSVTKQSMKNSNRPKSRTIQFPENIVLLEATARQDIDEILSLLKSGKYSPNTANEDGLTPIHQCSIDNSEDILCLLIEYGGDVNARDRDLWTPLHAAATCGHLQICRILVENGAELLALNADGNMPYDICDDELTLDYIETQMDRIGITQEMIDKTRLQIENKMLNDLQILAETVKSSSRSIDDVLSYRNAEGVTPLHIASANGYQSVVEYLLRQNVSINLQDCDGWAPIHAAAYWCQQPILELLIDAGADINEKLPDGRSALDLCDDPDLRASVSEFYEQSKRNQERAAAAAAAAAAAVQAAQIQQKTSPTNLMPPRPQALISNAPHTLTTRTGTLYESRSSVSSPYGSGSSLNRTSSIRRGSIRDREKDKKLNDNFLDVLQAKEKNKEDIDENVANLIATNVVPPTEKSTIKDERSSSVTTESTVRETTSTVEGKDSKTVTKMPSAEIQLPPLKIPPPLVPQAISDTLSDVKRRREERRRGTGFSTSVPIGSSSQLPPLVISSPLPSIDINQKNNIKVSNGNHFSAIHEPIPNFTAEKYIQTHGYVQDDYHEKRICCTIL